MSDLTMLGPWVRRFLLEHLVSERNLARNTQRSYRDTLTLLIPFVAAKANKPVDRLNVVDVSADLIRLFLAHLEESRRCHHNSQPASRINPCSRPLHSGAQPRAHCLVRPSAVDPVQENYQDRHSLS
jgi:hypothetical protein